MTVDVLAWVPGEPQICQSPETTEKAFNTWRGMITMMDVPADWQERAKPFLEDVAYLVPIEAERIRFLQWLAHIVQRPEILPHTAYLMIAQNRHRQEPLGVDACQGASRPCRSWRLFAGVFDGGSTGRLSQKLRAIVDEAREGSGEKRYVRAEKPKQLITQEPGTST